MVQQDTRNGSVLYCILQFVSAIRVILNRCQFLKEAIGQEKPAFSGHLSLSALTEGKSGLARLSKRAMVGARYRYVRASAHSGLMATAKRAKRENLVPV